MDLGSLAGALEQLAAAAGGGSRAACSFHNAHPPTVFDGRVATHLYRIAQESVSNAFHHGDARNVRISLEKVNGRTTLEVEDDGRGFSDASSSTDGLGLMIMRYRAGLIGGTLEIGPRRGGGTLVRCRLALPPPRRKRSSQETTIMAAKILIVDDHPAVREGLAVRIAAQPDMEVCGEAADIPQALDLAKTTAPDVVIVDIQLKTGNGLDLIERLKTHDKSVRVLVWSMYPDAVYAERALRAARWATSTRATRPAASSRPSAASAMARSIWPKTW